MSHAGVSQTGSFGGGLWLGPDHNGCLQTETLSQSDSLPLLRKILVLHCCYCLSLSLSLKQYTIVKICQLIESGFILFKYYLSILEQKR